MNPCRALGPTTSLRGNGLLWVLAGGWGWKFFGVLESSLSVLEEKWLEDGVSSLEALSLGQ